MRVSRSWLVNISSGAGSATGSVAEAAVSILVSAEVSAEGSASLVAVGSDFDGSET